jgi:predicted N-formylglutamate amidohydrolase
MNRVSVSSPQKTRYEPHRPALPHRSTALFGHQSALASAAAVRLRARRAEADLLDHIGWDIGAEAVTRRLAAIFGAPAVVATYSRLVIDANRPLDHSSSIPEESDARPIPANIGLDAAGRRARQEACFWPFHRAVSAQRQRLCVAQAAASQPPPVLVFIHSFTPSMADGQPRPWEVGILYAQDERLAAPLLHFLARTLGERLGDNQPYTGRDSTGYSAETHAAAPNLPHIMLELRNDLIRTDAGANLWAARLGTALRACPDVAQAV